MYTVYKIYNYNIYIYTYSNLYYNYLKDVKQYKTIRIGGFQ